MDSPFYYLWCPSGYNFHKISYSFVSEDLFDLKKQCIPRWNGALCCISSGSSLFAKVLKIQRVRAWLVCWVWRFYIIIKELVCHRIPVYICNGSSRSWTFLGLKLNYAWSDCFNCFVLVLIFGLEVISGVRKQT